MNIPVYFWVINTGDKPHIDKYAGELLTFEPGQPMLVTWSIVNTCFGYDEPSKINCLSRLGWIQPASQPKAIAAAEKRLEQFHIEPAEFAPPRGPLK